MKNVTNMKKFLAPLLSLLIFIAVACSFPLMSYANTVVTFATVGSEPNSIAFDSSGNLYVANEGSDTISKVTPGGSVSTFSGFCSPYALAFDSSDNLYVANSDNNEGCNNISKIIPSGTVTQTWATVGYNDSDALTVDSSGNLYVANEGSGTISMVTPGGSVTLNFATVGSHPLALAWDSSGNLYVANNGSGTISKIIFPPATAPGTPTFSSVTGTSLTVNWTAATNATSSNIYRCSGASCTPSLYQSGVTNTYYNETGLTPGTSYTYYIVGANSSGTGPASGSNSVTTLISSCTLSASPPSILNGQSSVLTWTSANATTVSIDHGIGTVTPTAGGTTSVSPTVSTTYTMTATGTGTGTCTATVIVGAPVERPSMNEFWSGFFRLRGGQLVIGPPSIKSQIFLTTTGTGSWTVPSNWNNASNTIQVIGGGQAGSDAGGGAEPGGAGGDYAAVTNLKFANPGTTVATYQVGAGGASGNANGGSTWFNGSTLAGSSVGATGGNAPGTDVGSVTALGGAGGGGPANGGGGGAGGPHGAGAAGAASGSGGAGGQGDNGFGGTGGSTSGAAGNPGTEWDSSHGSGGGGHSGSAGGSGGQYGAGGGGASSTTGGAGMQGIIVITYTHY